VINAYALTYTNYADGTCSVTEATPVVFSPGLSMIVPSWSDPTVYKTMAVEEFVTTTLGSPTCIGVATDQISPVTVMAFTRLMAQLQLTFIIAGTSRGQQNFNDFAISSVNLVAVVDISDNATPFEFNRRLRY
jgi:hypothetical protein